MNYRKIQIQSHDEGAEADADADAEAEVWTASRLSKFQRHSTITGRRM